METAAEQVKSLLDARAARTPAGRYPADLVVDRDLYARLWEEARGYLTPPPANPAAPPHFDFLGVEISPAP